MNLRSIVRITAACALLGAAALYLGSLGAVGAAAADDGQSLFDGKTLAGWDGDPKFWRVEDGFITGETKKDQQPPCNSFLVWKGGDVADFELELDYRFQSDWGNSGIQYRSFNANVKDYPWAIGGYQADCDSANSYTGILYGERYNGILSRRGEKTRIVLNPGGKAKVKPVTVEKFADPKELAKVLKINDWNHYRIVAQGFHYTHEINGKLMTDITDEAEGVRMAKGLLALQLHRGPPMKVQFRNLVLKTLKPATALDAPHRDRPWCGVQLTADSQPAAKKKIVFIAGKPSHPYLQHEHYAGCMLLAKLLNENEPRVETTVIRNGWPSDAKALDGADEIVIFSDGGAGHPAMQHIAELNALAKRGVGVTCIHYAVEIPKGEPGKAMLGWTGGYFETFWSVNPHWLADYKHLPEHPIARGVKPFSITDEWYYHMRFADCDKCLAPILTAIPPDDVHRKGPDAHGGNPEVFARKGQPEHMAWAFERPGGGRGFGFTGAHFHFNWGHPDFRKVVLNAIVWVAGLEVPQGGVPSKLLAYEDLKANLDTKKFIPDLDAKAQKLLQEWNAAAK